MNPFAKELQLQGFKVYEAPTQGNVIRAYTRKAFYKICIITGRSVIHYADKAIETNGTSLFFGNPHIPYSWQFISEVQTGYVCVFREDFLSSNALQESPLFKLGGTPVFFLDDEQRDFLSIIYRKMMKEQDTDYAFKVVTHFAFYL